MNPKLIPQYKDPIFINLKIFVIYYALEEGMLYDYMSYVTIYTIPAESKVLGGSLVMMTSIMTSS